MSSEPLGVGIKGSFHLGDHLVTPSANEINGTRIDPKAMDVLVALVEFAPAVISGQLLLDRAWPNVVVVDNVLHQAIAQLRKALGDEPRSPRYIETIPRRGYRIVARVQRSDPPNATESAEATDDAARGPTSTTQTRICVLPFINMSGDVEQEYFSDGICEDIITDLSKVSALSVIARHTAFSFKGQSFDVREVARQLNVSHLLEGSVRKVGDRVRITAQLVDGGSGSHLWAERYDRDLIDIFALQDEIAQSIVEALKLKLLPEEKRRITRQRTSSLEAYDLYLRGTRLVFSPEQELNQIDVLESATRLAPDFAEAWGALALCRASWRFSRPYSERDDIGAAVAADAARALALDPLNEAAALARWFLLPPFGRFAEGEVLIDNSPHSSPACDVLRAVHLESVGRIREAIEVAQRAYEMDPLHLHVANLRGQSLYFGGRYAEARLSFESTLARWPESRAAASNLIAVCVHTKDWAAVDSLLAPERLARFPLRVHEDTLLFASIMRNPSSQSRRKPIDAAHRRFEASGYADLTELQFAAQLGYSDEAHGIAAQAKYGSTGSPRDLMGFEAYRTHGLFSSIFPKFRRDRRFVDLCARLGLVDYWLMTQKWPDCVDEVAPYYDFKAECEKVAAGPPLPPAY